MARFIDPIGKGIRDAPRDALIAEITPPAICGAAYGLCQSMDAAGKDKRGFLQQRAGLVQMNGRYWLIVVLL